MSAEDNPPAGQADIGEALVAALGFEPTEGIKQGRKGASAANGSDGSTKPGANTGQRRSKKSRRKSRSGSGSSGSGGGRTTSAAAAPATKGDDVDIDLEAAASDSATVVAGDSATEAAAMDDAVVQGVKTALDDIKSAAKPAVSDRSKIIVGGGTEDDLEDGWVAVDAPPDEEDASSSDGDGDDGGDTSGNGSAPTAKDAGPATDDQADEQSSSEPEVESSSPAGDTSSAKSDATTAGDTKASGDDAAAKSDSSKAGSSKTDSSTTSPAKADSSKGGSSNTGPGKSGAAGKASGKKPAADADKPAADTSSTASKGSPKAGTNRKGKQTAAAAKADASPGSSTPSKGTDASEAVSDDTLVGGPPIGEATPAAVADPEPSTTPAADTSSTKADVAQVAAATGELDRTLVQEAVESAAAPSFDGITEISPGVAAPSAPPVAESPSTAVARLDTTLHPAHTGEIRRVETRDDEIQAARLEAEARAREQGREVFQRGSFINLFRRSRRLQSRKVRRVVRHIDPWSVLTFSVLFHLCVFAALLLASVLVWNAAEAAGTIEDLEGFILELGDYETFEIKGDVVFRAAVGIAGILTLASSVLLVLVTVVFNLISDLVGGIRLTVIEEETVRVRRRKADPELDPTG